MARHASLVCQHLENNSPPGARTIPAPYPAICREPPRRLCPVSARKTLLRRPRLKPPLPPRSPPKGSPPVGTGIPIQSKLNGVLKPHPSKSKTLMTAPLGNPAPNCHPAVFFQHFTDAMRMVSAISSLFATRSIFLTRIVQSRFFDSL